MFSLKSFYREIKNRQIRKMLVIYVGSGLTLLGAINLFSSVYHISYVLFDCVLVVLLYGLPSALVYKWYHGVEGKQKMQKKEIIIHSLAVVVATVSIIWITNISRVRLLPRDAKTIAVLPFKNLSDNKDDEYFSDGIMEDILTQLSKISDLRVISRTSVMQYKDTKKNLRQIGEELGAGTILEGTVRRFGTRVRIVGQLINSKKDEHIWAETYDREMKDVFAIQTEVAKNIASALKATLTPKELQQIENKSTSNLEAYSYYLRGREYYHDYTEQNNERAAELFRKALELDSNYALAYAGLADALVWKRYYDFSPEWIDSALMLSIKAISINPNLAEGYKALGSVYTSKEQHNMALEQYIKAVELNPNYAAAVTNIGFTYYTLGCFDEALKWMKKAIVIEPGSARWTSNVGLQYFGLGYDSLATVWFRKALILKPEFFFPNIVLAYIDLFSGNFVTARTRIGKVLTFHPDVYSVVEAAGDIELIMSNFNQAKSHYQKAIELSSYRSSAGIKLAYVLLKLNKRPDAMKILNMNLPHDAEDLSEFKDGTSTYYTAASYCIAQNSKQSLRLLKLAIELGFRDYRWILIDPLFTPLRNNEEFKLLITKLKSQIDRMRKRVMVENL